LLGDYFGRLSFILSRGECVTNLLMLHPFNTAWMNFSPIRPSYHNVELDRAFSTMNKMLCEMHRDYDLGDDILMEKHGRVEKNKFCIGRMSYEVVIVPPCAALRDSTLELLKKFVGNGGKVIAIKPTPTLVNGLESAELVKFLSPPTVRVIEESREALRAALNAVCPPDVTITDTNGKDIYSIYYQHRRDGNTHIYFFSSLDKNQGYEATIELASVSGPVEEWDLVTGERRSILAQQANGRFRLQLEFPPVGSRLIIVGPQAKSSAQPRRQVVKEATSLGAPRIARTQLNALPLDYVQYKIQDGIWSQRMYVRKAFKEIRGFYGLSAEDYRCAQFWLTYQRKKDFGPQSRIALKYDFHVDALPGAGKQMFLIVETPERFHISVNDQSVSTQDGGWWIDQAFRKFDITGLIRQDRNEVLLECPKFEEDVEIEACYLAGDFCVRQVGNQCAIIPEPDQLPKGDWTRQGYPFYAGSFAYSYDFEAGKLAKKDQYILRADFWEGVAVRVIVNRENAGAIGWRPYEVDITEHLKRGKNLIAVEVMNSLRNLLGPHHAEGVLPGMASPNHFFTGGANWTDSYNLVPSGLTGDVKVLKMGDE
jgi:hypothetical protein